VASHRRVRGRCGPARAAGLVCTAIAAATLLPAVGYADPLGTTGNDPAPADNSPDAVKQQVAELYQQAEADTQAYDATEERIARLQAAVADAGARTTRLRAQLDAASGSLGRIAAEQYRSAGVSPTLALAFNAHPDTFLERAGFTDWAAGLQHERVLEVEKAQQDLDALEATSAANLADLHTAELQLAAHKADIEARLTAARNRLDALSTADRGAVTAALDQAGGAGTGGGDGLGVTISAAAPSLSSLISAINSAANDPGSSSDNGGNGGNGGNGDGTQDDASGDPPPDVSRAVKAVSSAYSELGKPYVWGATGPGQFDCSGLTQHVWASAGVHLPRTSQEQADAGATVPVSDIRPGDLVVYFSGQTHIGIYVGEGMVIHAPRPGSVVQFAPLKSMPINRIVRPVG
jgi:cell wall-associated NlpC family hydrolase